MLRRTIHHLFVVRIQIGAFGVPGAMQEHYKGQFRRAVPAVRDADPVRFIGISICKVVSPSLITLCLPLQGAWIGKGLRELLGRAYHSLRLERRAEPDWPGSICLRI